MDDLQLGLLDGYPVLDLESALDHTGGDCELLLQLCAVFTAECPAELEEVRTAVETCSRIWIGRAAHKLKGSTSVLGGVQASEAALQLERLADSGDHEQLRAGFEALRLAVGSLLARVKQWENESDVKGAVT